MRSIVLQSLGNAIIDLVDASNQIDAEAPDDALLEAVITRGAFRPGEDEAIGFWFARFLGVRESLWGVIQEVLMVLEKPTDEIERQQELHFFVVGYAAVCLLMRIDRIMLFRVGRHSIVQRKLNEAFPEYGIPRKQYTTIFSAFVDQKNVFVIRDAMQLARKRRDDILQLQDDIDVGFIVQNLGEFESSLDPSKLSYVRRAWSYVSHKWRRRGAVSVKNILAGIFEGFGRTASEFYAKQNKGVSDDVLASIGRFLEPGDVIVTRHTKALTNLFFPGFWPHAAFYVGTDEQRDAAGISIDPEREKRWSGDICVLEAKKDGVLLRPLSDTLSVDTFVVLRPNLKPASIHQAIERAVMHEGKKFNFDFDFFNSDRVVCTEVIYRAYDGIEGLKFPLQDRAGRKTLSAEDLLDFALETAAFNPVAIFGVKDCEDTVEYGSRVREALISSYRRPA
jgi:hypothetical protein